MSALISAKNLTKYYGGRKALNNLTFDIHSGQIIGLIGPNGAGKTTLLKSILGLIESEGALSVMGKEPRHARSQLMERVSFISDVAVLPRWLKVRDAIKYVQGVHPRFDKSKALKFLAGTDIPMNAKVRALSKGMVVQLHLALIMAIDAELLILDEPTLGLDIIYRKTFYNALMNDYFNEHRTIIISTHQVEEIEGLLTDLMFINHGQLLLNCTMDDLANQYIQVIAKAEHVATLEGLSPLAKQTQLGKQVFLFEGQAKDKLAQYGEIIRPTVSDVFVAKVTGERTCNS